MRSSNQKTAETKARIVDTAARLFRERGIGGLSVADLMEEAGLTHGGFYKHFASKDALAAAACKKALDDTRADLSERAGKAAETKALQTLVRTYLSPAHRDQPGLGCAIAALGPEAMRESSLVKDTLSEGIASLADLIREQITRSGKTPEANRAANAVLSSLVGALVLSRVVNDQDTANAILTDTQAYILDSMN
jgi:TetR/AcrR family transcriptional repressor of nem operon